MGTTITHIFNDFWATRYFSTIFSFMYNLLSTTSNIWQSFSSLSIMIMSDLPVWKGWSVFTAKDQKSLFIEFYRTNPNSTLYIFSNVLILVIIIIIERGKKKLCLLLRNVFAFIFCFLYPLFNCTSGSLSLKDHLEWNMVYVVIVGWNGQILERINNCCQNKF